MTGNQSEIRESSTPNDLQTSQEYACANSTPDGFDWTSSTTSSIEDIPISATQFYFQVAVVVIAVIGSFANGGVLFILLTGKQVKKKMMNVLLINQVAIDLYSCVTLVITYSVKLRNIYLTGSFGYWLCVILTGEMLLWFGLNSSMINLGVITVERYVKVVHHVWHKNYFRPWMAYTACVFSWISGSLMNLLLYLFTSEVENGQCLAVVIWKKKSDNIFFGIWYYLYYFQLPLILFIYCYGRILHVIRRQNRIFLAQYQQHGDAPNHSAPQNDQKSQRNQMSAIKTMIMLTAFFAISWLPNHVYYLIINVADASLNLLNDGWYGTLFVAFFNICANPLIYVASYDDVKMYLAKKVGWAKMQHATSFQVTTMATHAM
jgi:7 transmembrane receptor (rhodopsin family)